MRVWPIQKKKTARTYAQPPRRTVGAANLYHIRRKSEGKTGKKFGKKTAQHFVLKLAGNPLKIRLYRTAYQVALTIYGLRLTIYNGFLVL